MKSSITQPPAPAVKDGRPTTKEICHPDADVTAIGVALARELGRLESQLVTAALCVLLAPLAVWALRRPQRLAVVYWHARMAAPASPARERTALPAPRLAIDAAKLVDPTRVILPNGDYLTPSRDQ
jgi:hypothetical protein